MFLIKNSKKNRRDEQLKQSKEIDELRELYNTVRNENRKLEQQSHQVLEQTVLLHQRNHDLEEQKALMEVKVEAFKTMELERERRERRLHSSSSGDVQVVKLEEPRVYERASSLQRLDIEQIEAQRATSNQRPSCWMYMAQCFPFSMCMKTHTRIND